MSVDDASDTVDTQLEEFYNFLFDQRQGYVYAATKEIGHDVSWKQHFFTWPNQQTDLVRFTLSNRARKDVYIAPAMFREKQATKEFVIGANVIWAEFDDAPSLPEGVPNPTCRIASGGDGHEHWYWKLQELLNSDQLDIVNRALAYHLDADPSGWDSTQVLRPPGTFNHKRKRETTLIQNSRVVLSVALFGNIPEPPLKQDIEEPQYIPPVEEVVMKYPMPKVVRDLFSSHDPSDRSDALMSLGYHCAELGMAKFEILSMIINADERWGKFKGRDDRMRRLLEIVSIALTKYPTAKPSNLETINLKPMGFKTLLNTEVKLEWQWDGFLQRGGYFLLTGPTQVGKTQFSLDAAGHMALGKSFLNREMKPAKIGFFSLEMGLIDLKYFLSQMQYSFSLEEQDILEKNLQLFPLGEPMYMTDERTRDELEQIVGDLKLDGIIVDSLGSATDDSVSDEKIKKFFHWNDRFRQKLGIFTWYIHHHRKASGDNRKPNKIADVYGSQYITSYATSVVCLWETGIPNHISFITLKKRLAPRDPTFVISRDERLHFVRVGVSENQVSNPTIAPGLLLGPGSPLGIPAPAVPLDPLKPVGGNLGVSGTSFSLGAWSVGPATKNELEETLKEVNTKEKTITLNMKGIE